jgi:hypothetical protein
MLSRQISCYAVCALVPRQEVVPTVLLHEGYTYCSSNFSSELDSAFVALYSQDFYSAHANFGSPLSDPLLVLEQSTIDVRLLAVLLHEACEYCSSNSSFELDQMGDVALSQGFWSAGSSPGTPCPAPLVSVKQWTTLDEASCKYWSSNFFSGLDQACESILHFKTFRALVGAFALRYSPASCRTRGCCWHWCLRSLWLVCMRNVNRFRLVDHGGRRMLLRLSPILTQSRRYIAPDDSLLLGYRDVPTSIQSAKPPSFVSLFFCCLDPGSRPFKLRLCRLLNNSIQVDATEAIAIEAFSAIVAFDEINFHGRRRGDDRINQKK